ncbi:recombinase family protein [Kitasatospora sp. NPDC056800]|uniref:recombinase family protein n=1 Tax=Kitasatospora sp. NPDC056800 TaxID=3345948 RepID=UPI0036C1B6C7
MALTWTDTLSVHQSTRGEAGGGVLNVAGYTRLSDDGELGDGRDGRQGVLRQGEDITGLSRAREWHLTKIYEDNDTSAYKRRVKRKAFEQLLTDLQSGALDGIVAYNIDRVARQPRDLERLIDIYETSRRKLVFATCTQDFDLSDPDGRFNARLYVSVANKYSADISRRAARKNLDSARKGKVHAGRRAFGWKDDGKTLDEFESGLLRQAREDIRNGKLIGTIRAEWIAAGVKPSETARSGDKQRPISHSTVEHRIINPRICGYRVYIPQAEREKSGKRFWAPDHIMLDDKGNKVTGDWETDCSVEEWEEIVEILKSRKAKKASGAPHDTAAKRLLSGVCRCPHCGTGMRPNPYTPGTTAAEKYGFRYQCRTVDGGCGKVSRVGPPIDELVESAFLKQVERQVGDAQAKHTAEDAEISKAQAALNRIEEDKAVYRESRDTGEMSAKEFVLAIKSLEAQEAKHLAKLRELRAQVKLKTASLPAVLKQWSRFTMDQKRAHLLEVVEAVIVHPAGRGKRFDPALIEIIWR